MIAGLDVGGTKALGLLIDPATGEILDRERTSSAGDGAALVETLAGLVAQLRERNDASIKAVGLGIAGLVSTSGVVHYSPNLPDLVEFPIGEELSRVLGIKVPVANDANTGAWAEAKLGAGRGADDFVFVALGTGIGTGFVIDGRLVTGASGLAGESGHMVIDASGPVHLTGQQGPWEYFASGNALGRLGREAAVAGRFGSGPDAAGSVEAITGRHVATACAAGDVEAAAIMDDFCREVARGVANLVVLLDPQRIVIGGGLADVGEPLRAGIDQWLGELLLGSQHRPPVEVVLAELGSDAGALGAALMAVDLG